MSIPILLVLFCYSSDERDINICSFLRFLAAMVYRFDPSFKDCNFKKAPFLNGTTKAKDSLAQNGVFNPIYGYIWENAFVKFVNFGLFRPNEKMSARQVVYSKRPHDGEYLVSPELLAYFDWTISVSIFANVNASLACANVNDFYVDSLNFYKLNHELALDCLAYCLSEYYDIVLGPAAKSARDAQDCSDQQVPLRLAPSLDELKARRASAGKGGYYSSFSP